MERSNPVAQRGRRPARPDTACTSQRPTAEIVQRQNTRVAPRAYAVRARDEPEPADVIRGTFSLYDLLVCALIDLGSTYSYVCITPPVDSGVQVEELEQDIHVTNPLGHNVMVRKVYKGCLLRIQGYEFLVDLIELPFHEFNVILGMDCLSRHQAIVDY